VAQREKSIPDSRPGGRGSVDGGGTVKGGRGAARKRSAKGGPPPGGLPELLQALRAMEDGDFTTRVSLNGDPLMVEIAEAFNGIASMNERLAKEVVRVSTTVGRQGQMTDRASLEGAGGGWQQTIGSMNSLITDLMQPTTEVARVLTAVARGDLSQKMGLEIDGIPLQGEFLRIGTTVNTMVDQLSSFASEATRVAREVGTDGVLGGQAEVPRVAGIWKDLTDNVNFMASNLTSQVRAIKDVTTAVAYGDLSQKITIDARGEILELKETINTMVDRLSVFADEVTRVAREVGTEGKLGGQADVPNVAGTWKDLTENVNFMAGNLTAQVRNIALVTTAVARGDLSQKITVDVRGEVLELKDTINTMVDQLGAFADEVTRVAREVGTEGVLGGRAEVEGVGGVWADLTDNVNAMAGNLTVQLRDMSAVSSAIADGDLGRKITVEARGEILQIKEVINSMVDRLGVFAGEVTRVAREVGTEGVLGGQAHVPNVGGTWKDLTENVNFMAGNLTAQVRDIALVTTAVANGDLSQKISVDVRGEVLELKDTINSMVDRLRIFAGEVTRVAREVGTDGMLGGQAEVPNVAGTWKDLTDNVNFMASNLTDQVRAIKDVTTAVANGDLSQKITVDVKGEILELKSTINTMVDQLGAFADEVTRVAREVGTEGVLGGQAEVAGVGGVWKDLTDNVNAMAGNLTVQLRDVSAVATAIADGDLTRKITVEARGEILQIKEVINLMVDRLGVFAGEVTRVAREVGTEGVLGGQASVPNVGGTWKDLTESVNSMAGNLTAQVRNIADVTTAVARGDLSRKITVDVKGEILELKDTINTMVDQLGAFASEVTRVAREVGTEGVLGGQASVPGVGGTWKDLTDNVNFMASNLTGQVRNIALVATAIANGDLSQKITVDVKGEILELKDTINSMVDRLSVFADEVTRMAREVGTEGKLGGQADVPNVAGTWKDLTENVNAMANSLTDQVRAIKDVAIAVTEGDLTRMIMVDARGELDELKRNINQMIVNLRDTTEKNQEQDWLKSNLAKFGRIMQGQKDLDSVARLIMSELTPLVGAHHGAFFIKDMDSEEEVLGLLASYAYKARKSVSNRFHLGEGLVGQSALERKPILLTSVPDDYVQISSGLGEAPPRNIIVLPILFEGEVKAVVELASFHPFNQIHQLFLDQLTESIGVVLNMIQANMRTEELLLQSQKLTQELQSQSQELQTQQEELRRTNAELEAQANSLRSSEEALKEQQEELQQVNEELEEKASLLAEQNKKVEQKNEEVEAARLALEEKAEQLALSSRYKSEFLANMSHELRTPLNSLLILARLLSENKEENLTEKQVEYAQTIHGAGSDLLTLIDDVLDLSKIEAGRMEVQRSEVLIADIREFVRRSFEPIAQDKDLDFAVDLEPGLPETVFTDAQRVQQVLKNLLSNSLKFTSEGKVALTIRVADSSRRFGLDSLNQADRVIAFAVSDTGIGIPKDKQRLIFEAFQQADGSTNRQYGGTGLGLSISREIARLLGGEIRVESTEGAGSTFTLFIPERYLGEEGEQGEDDSATHTEHMMGGGARARVLPRQRVAPMPDAAGAGPSIHDDRSTIEDGDRVVLIVENDVTFARVLLEMARENGFKGIVALDGESGLAMAEDYRPDAVTLDIDLPGMDGWTVLDRLKHRSSTRHIPVHIVTGTKTRKRGLRQGALSYLEKPVSKEALDSAFEGLARFIDEPVRNLLVVEDDATQRQSIIELVGGEDDVDVTAVETAEEALQLISERRFDCMVLDLGLADMSGFTLLEKIKNDPDARDLPIIVYTGKDLSPTEDTELRRYAETIIVKDVKSPERLLDETALFLHRIESRLPQQKRSMLERLHNVDTIFQGKKVLIADDDVRNIFSLTSVLESYGMTVVFAENGRAALEVLESNPDVELVLLDVMMPEMDGYETAAAIRAIDAHKNLPIIAVTAKAMKGDREKTIAAGASDYITKPVDTEQLLSLMRVWLYS
jgi:HAMP domain-containing protein/CheY-like chemotaxis protein/signal transduction histidine kinase